MRIYFLLVFFIITSIKSNGQVSISIDKIRNKPWEPYLIFDISIQNTSKDFIQFESPLYSGEFYSNYARINLIAKSESKKVEIYPYNTFRKTEIKICELDPLEKYTTRMIISKRHLFDKIEDHLKSNSLSFQIKLNVIPNPDSNNRKLIESNWVKTKISKIDGAITNWAKNLEIDRFPLLFYDEFMLPFDEEGNFWKEEHNLEYAQQFIQAFPKSIYSEWATYFILTYKYNRLNKDERSKFENGIKKLKWRKDILLKERIEKQIELNKIYAQFDKKSKK